MGLEGSLGTGVLTQFPTPGTWKEDTFKELLSFLCVDLKLKEWVSHRLVPMSVTNSFLFTKMHCLLCSSSSGMCPGPLSDGCPLAFPAHSSRPAWVALPIGRHWRHGHPLLYLWEKKKNTMVKGLFDLSSDSSDKKRKQKQNKKEESLVGTTGWALRSCSGV